MAFLPWFSQVMKHVPEFKHMNHSIDSKALCKCLEFSVHLSCLHQLQECTEICLSGAFQDCLYTRTTVVKITKQKIIIKKKKRDRSRKGRHREKCGMLILSCSDVSPLGRSTVLPWDLGISNLS